MFEARAPRKREFERESRAWGNLHEFLVIPACANAYLLFIRILADFAHFVRRLTASQLLRVSDYRLFFAYSKRCFHLRSLICNKVFLNAF